ncbi:HAD domain-containing protein [Flavihumibacter petaseus]|uniref:FCP1 homology domain-containing protein n=1 Tax=Flavihumibacter petaseus NBRC 106054 TaxID=1220578 RepID=A0A0E9N123_9BACT|nr:HAD domain-containing protein [Flavihumibacter petaseus]GAO43045.1 hypothetical protein FPE01S_02_01500 [Flavihumibacter petaseus NBRC 106054]
MLIFLDIDGVMVPAKGWKVPELMDDGFPAFSNRAVVALAQIIARKNTIILTSSHKANFSIQEWKSIFKRRGIDIEKLQRLPASPLNVSRKEELMKWFSSHPMTGDFVIIDDDSSLNELPVEYKRALVQTSPTVGLTEEHVNAIIDLTRNPE